MAWEWSFRDATDRMHLSLGVKWPGWSDWKDTSAWRYHSSAAAHEHHQHGHDDTKLINTGHGLVNLSVFEIRRAARVPAHLFGAWQGISSGSGGCQH